MESGLGEEALTCEQDSELFGFGTAARSSGGDEESRDDCKGPSASNAKAEPRRDRISTAGKVIESVML